MPSPVPRLIDFSEKVQNSLANRLRHVKQELSDIEIAYREFVNDMRTQACEKNGYWTFDLDVVSVDDVSRWCEFDPDVVVSQYWRLVGSFEDIISLAKLLGYTYQRHGKEIILPGFGPEDSYWIRSLQMMKVCHEKSVDSDINMPCSKNYSNVLSRETPLLWKFASPQSNKFKLCKCCTDDDTCSSKYPDSTRPFSPITPVIVLPQKRYQENGKCSLAHDTDSFISGLSPIQSPSPSREYISIPQETSSLTDPFSPDLPSVTSVISGTPSSLTRGTSSFNQNLRTVTPEIPLATQESPYFTRGTNIFNRDFSLVTPATSGTQLQRRNSIYLGD